MFQHAVVSGAKVYGHWEIYLPAVLYIATLYLPRAVPPAVSETLPGMANIFTHAVCPLLGTAALFLFLATVHPFALGFSRPVGLALFWEHVRVEWLACLKVLGVILLGGGLAALVPFFGNSLAFRVIASSTAGMVAVLKFIVGADTASLLLEPKYLAAVVAVGLIVVCGLSLATTFLDNAVMRRGGSPRVWLYIPPIILASFFPSFVYAAMIGARLGL